MCATLDGWAPIVVRKDVLQLSKTYHALGMACVSKREDSVSVMLVGLSPGIAPLHNALEQ